MDYMFEIGFLGTRAPFFMDFVTIIVSVLPILVAVAISFAKNKKYKAHILSQSILFVVSMIVIGYFEYGVRLGGGFNMFMTNSSVSHSYAWIVLIIHICIAVYTLVIWSVTMFHAVKYKTCIVNSKHKKFGIFSFVGILLTSMSGLWVYFLLFVF